MFLFKMFFRGLQNPDTSTQKFIPAGHSWGQRGAQTNERTVKDPDRQGESHRLMHQMPACPTLFSMIACAAGCDHWPCFSQPTFRGQWLQTSCTFEFVTWRTQRHRHFPRCKILGRRVAESSPNHPSHSFRGLASVWQAMLFGPWMWLFPKWHTTAPFAPLCQVNLHDRYCALLRNEVFVSSVAVFGLFAGLPPGRMIHASPWNGLRSFARSSVACREVAWLSSWLEIIEL